MKQRVAEIPAPVAAQPAAAVIAPVEAKATWDTAENLRIFLGVLTVALVLGAIAGRLWIANSKRQSRPAPRRAIWDTPYEGRDQPRRRIGTFQSDRVRAEDMDRREIEKFLLASRRREQG